MSCGIDSFIRGGLVGEGVRGAGGVLAEARYLFCRFSLLCAGAPPVSAECRVSQSIRKYEIQDVSFNLLDFPS